MMNTSVPRMFSSIWNETSESGNRRSRAWPTDTPRKFAMSRVSSGCALPEKTFSSPNPVAMNGSPTLSPSMTQVGWGGRIRTFEYGVQSPAPYRLATPQPGPYVCGVSVVAAPPGSEAGPDPSPPPAEVPLGPDPLGPPDPLPAPPPPPPDDGPPAPAPTCWR